MGNNRAGVKALRQGRPGVLEVCFSNLNVPTNPLQTLLKCKF